MLIIPERNQIKELIKMKKIVLQNFMWILASLHKGWGVLYCDCFL